MCIESGEETRVELVEQVMRSGDRVECMWEEDLDSEFCTRERYRRRRQSWHVERLNLNRWPGLG